MLKPKIALMQPCYIPWLGLFHMWSHADHIVWLDSYQYTKNSFANRNRISNQGKYFWLTVPVNAHLGQTYLEVAPSFLTQWQKKHISTIKQVYKKAPYFYQLEQILDLIGSSTYLNLAELNIAVLESIGSQLKLSAQTSRSSSLIIHSQSRSERVREIINQLGGITYLAAAGAKNYMLEDGGWDNGNFDVYIQHFHSPQYSQINASNFLENLSVIDVIANVGFDGVNHLIEMRATDWEKFTTNNTAVNYS